MTNSIATMEIKRIAKQVTRFVNRYKGANLVDRVQAILSVELEGFANQGIAKSLVYDALSGDVYATIFPQIGMTAEGNWTYDSKLWA